MFGKVLLSGGFAALAAAQSAVLTFTHVPSPPVTIILRKGLSNDLQTIATLTSSATGGQYIWTPATSLADGTDYALEITQGSQINYFGPFQVQGATASAIASASPYISSTVSANGTASTTVPIAPVTVGTMSAGTGTALPRNTTMSMATLTSSSASSTAGSSSSITAAGATGASSSGAGFQGSATASASTSTSGASAIQFSSVFTLLFGIAAAAFYLQ